MSVHTGKVTLWYRYEPGVKLAAKKLIQLHIIVVQWAN